MIDFEKETLMSLRELAQVTPKIDGKRISTATLWRWCRKGMRGIKMDYARLGSRIVTSVEALNRFQVELAEQDEQIATPEPRETSTDKLRRRRTAKQQAVDLARANKRLKDAGI